MIRETGKLVQLYPADSDFELISIEADETPFVLGRENGCQLVLKDNSVSRQHASINLTGEGYQLEDLRSMNGTRINGQKVEKELLRSGDKIRIGRRIFQFINIPDIEKQYRDAMFAIMTGDALTNCWNRRYAMSVVQRELKRRQRTRQPLSVLLLDLDRFTMLNDHFGHLAGDEVLIEVSQRIRLIVRDEDIVSRFSGEQFLVVLCDTPLEQARLIAERCRETVAETPIQSMAGRVDCTVSIGIGIANVDNPFMPLEDLLAKASENLEVAKTLGRNRVAG